MEPSLASGVCLLVEESIYYIGGVSPEGVHSSKIFKFSNIWEPIEANPTIFAPRSGHCGFALNSDIYIFGGQCESENLVFNTSYKLNLKDNTWIILPNLPQPRHSSSCVTYNSKGLIFGGANQEGVLDSLLIFNPGKN
ncbi:hypothetical protein SteCoe_10881 [Stentor coeruleus]|uniref:Uncharacterized protein n=1 Tax=Stentor coeruleus TaxID=5963 RepID=A0A1R2CEC4_9CILI|nr:hypothetical protein SteCoe_10881 [Stentor coeruleus]